MDNPIFVDDGGNKPLATHYDENRHVDNGYDEYDTPNTSKIAEATLTMPGFTDKQEASTLQLRKKSRTK